MPSQRAKSGAGHAIQSKLRLPAQERLSAQPDQYLTCIVLVLEDV